MPSSRGSTTSLLERAGLWDLVDEGVDGTTVRAEGLHRKPSPTCCSPPGAGSASRPGGGVRDVRRRRRGRTRPASTSSSPSTTAARRTLPVSGRGPGGVGPRRDPRAIARRATPRRTRLFEVTFRSSRGPERAASHAGHAGSSLGRSRSIRCGALHERQALDVLEWKSALRANSSACSRHPLVDLLRYDVPGRQRPRSRLARRSRHRPSRLRFPEDDPVAPDLDRVPWIGVARRIGHRHRKTFTTIVDATMRGA